MPVAFVVVGVLAGLFLEKVILRGLGLLAERTEWPIDNVIFRAFRGVPLFWGAAVGLYLALLTFELSEEKVVLLQDVLLAAVLWSVTIIVARIAAGLVSAYAGREGTFLPATSIIPGLIRLLIYVVGALIVMGELAIPIAPLLTALGVGGLAVALALQDTLSNVFAGLYLIASREINPGDYVSIAEGEEGYVLDINWRSTTIQTLLDNTVIVPNAKLASSIVTNYHLVQRETIIRVPVPVDYESDLEQVERVTLEVAREAMEEVVPNVRWEPRLYLHTFGEFSLNLTVLMRVRNLFDQYRLRHVFMQKLVARYRQEGIRIPFPIKEFEMELSTEGLDAGRRGQLRPPDGSEGPAANDDVMRRTDRGGSLTS